MTFSIHFKQQKYFTAHFCNCQSFFHFIFSFILHIICCFYTPYVIL
jgi:hypothetical protein